MSQMIKPGKNPVKNGKRSRNVRSLLAGKKRKNATVAEQQSHVSLPDKFPEKQRSGRVCHDWKPFRIF